MVADVLRVQGDAEGPDPHPLPLQRPQDLLVCDPLVPLHREVPDEEGAEEQQCAAQGQSRQQRVPPPEPAQEEGYPLLPHHGQPAVQLFHRPAQGVVIPPVQPAGEGSLGLPLHIPEGQVPGAAQIQHPLRKGGLHPDPDLALEPVDDLIQHGVTSPTPRRQCPRRSAAPPPSWPSGPGGRPGPAARRR